MNADERRPNHGITRRSLVVSAAIVPLSAVRSAAAPTAAALSPQQLKLVDAIADRIIPKDENGPGASECGAANYIERALADALAGEKNAFVDGIAAIDAFAVKSQGKAFVELTADAKDTVLTAVDGNTAFPNSRAFFTRIRRLTLEGTFSDPFYGGNNNFAGWDLIGYPGPRLAVGPDEQKMHVTIKPVHQSSWGGAKNGH
jgi:gluconate 2-dehydrogenase gamma chain